jgi:K+-transporting ATPase c subunit
MKKAIGALSFMGMTFLMIGLALSQGVYTGLIVDAGNLSFTPSASPKILDEDGREVYGSAYLDKEWVEKHGVVGYAKSLTEGKANSRVAGNPYVVKAIKVTGPNSKDLIVSNADAQKIRELTKYLNFLDHAKVVIVVP